MVGEELVGYDAVSGRRRQSPSEIDFFCLPMTVAVGYSPRSARIGAVLASHSLCVV